MRHVGLTTLHALCCADTPACRPAADGQLCRGGAGPGPLAVWQAGLRWAAAGGRVSGAASVGASLLVACCGCCCLEDACVGGLQAAWLGVRGPKGFKHPTKSSGHTGTFHLSNPCRDEEEGGSDSGDSSSRYHFGRRAALGHFFKRHWFRCAGWQRLRVMRRRCCYGLGGW